MRITFTNNKSEYFVLELFISIYYICFCCIFSFILSITYILIMIHHYTSIENLALILDSKKIRFNRLDKFDDITEASVFSKELAFVASSIFASSWTEDEEENIPLWKMYASIDKGVRISLPIDMFEKNLIEPFNGGNHGLNETLISPFTKDETFYNGHYFIINIFSDECHDFFKKVKYRNDYGDLYKSYIDIRNDGVHFSNIWEWGMYKRTKWNFQKESRFTIYTKPLLPLEHPNIHGDKYLQFAPENTFSNISNTIEYIDVRLRNDALKQMVITLAPKVNEAQKLIVKALIRDYPTIRVRESELCNELRK